MKLSNLRPQRGVLTTGFVLLAAFGVAIFLVGRTINRIALKMNRTIVREVCDNHYAALRAEFEKSARPTDIVAGFLSAHPQFTREEAAILADALRQSDPKISRIWLQELPSGRTETFARDETAPETDTLLPRSGNDLRDAPAGSIYRSRPIPHLSFVRTFRTEDGRAYRCGTDIALCDLYAYLTVESLATKSYAVVYETGGRIVSHPDSLLIGTPASEEALGFIARVKETRAAVRTAAVSGYLGIPVQRVYFPLEIGDERWVVAVSVPEISVSGEIDEFHRYTAVLSLLAVLLFSILLTLYQRRWKREYELRRQAEKESAQLHLQQVIEQINPHFLFNSLTSLYALIADDARLAREFVLKLSGVYRYVLEKGRSTLSRVGDELDFTLQYYFLQKIRFENQIEMTIGTDTASDDLLIPSMSLQTLVENAIKHNKITPDNPLRIRIYTRDDRLVIENNYTPRRDSDRSSLGIGLERIRTIYRFYSDQEITVSTEGSVFRCTLPLLPPEKEHRKSDSSFE